MGIKRLSRFFAFILVIAILSTLPCAAAPASGAGYQPEAVYVTVTSHSAVRVNWPAYDYAGYSFALQVKIDDGAFETAAVLSRGVTSYSYSGIRAQSVYAFRVMLRESGSGRDDEPYHNEVVYRPAGAPVEPSTPSLIQISTTEIQLSWAYSGGASYDTEIQRRRDGDTGFTGVIVVPAGINRYVDASLEPDTLYRYRIRAKYGPAVYSDYRESGARSAIETPQITEVYAASPSSVYVAWTPTADAVRYRLERMKKGDLDYTVVTTTASDRAYFTDFGIIPGERYYYRVKAISQDRSESLYSDAAEAVVIQIDAPQAITAISTGVYRVELVWQDAGDRESAYEIWRYDEQFPGWRLHDTTERDAKVYIDIRVGPGERYVYKIRARSVDFDSVSKFSAEARTETVFLPAPSNLRQTNASGSSVNLSWRDNSPNEDRFIIERRGGSAGPWIQVATIGANVTERAGLSAPANSAWYFRVGAYSNQYRSVAYSEPLLADNGFSISIRGSSYRTDANGEDGGGPAPGGSSGGASGNIGGARLDSNAIRELARRNVVNVSGGNIAGGGDPVTRGEFVAMLVRALRVEGAPLGSFGDVQTGHPFYEDIMRGARLGFVKPETADLFFPDRVITRAEMAVFVYDSLLAYGSPLPPHGYDAVRAFPDADDLPPSLAVKVRSVFGEEIMIGIGVTGGRIIGIDRESTREQAALVIYRYIQWVNIYA